MPTTVSVPPEFLKAIKRLKRSYPAVTGEVRKLVRRLEHDERPGNKISGAQSNLYKARLPNPSAQRGKSGGFRVIYYLLLSDRVILVTIYSKSQQVDINPARLRRLLDAIDPSDYATDISTES